MDDRSFTSWVRRQQRLDGIMPQADKVVPLVAGAGSTGMTRRELGHAVRLDRDTLDELLAGLVRLGLLTLTWENGVPVFRSQNAVGGSHGLPS
jgi:hypothetical protein